MKSHIRLIAAGIVIGGTLASAPSMVSADSFTPLPGRPNVTIDSRPLGIQPKYESSEASYTVDVTVATNAELQNLETVSMCWYKGLASGNSEWYGCPADGDPNDGFEMVWTQSSNSFAVTGDNHYENVGSSSTYAPTSQSMEMEFTFKVSNAMLAGSDWNVRVIASYDRALVDEWGEYADTSGFDEESGTTVNYWGQITTPRASQSFGSVAQGDSAFLYEIKAAEWVANAVSDFTLAGTDFSNASSDVLTLRSGAGDPDVDEVTLDCAVNNSLFLADPVRIPRNATSNPQTFLTTILTGTFVSWSGESPMTDTSMDCLLTYGGGAATALSAYTNTVSIGIVQVSEPD